MAFQEAAGNGCPRCKVDLRDKVVLITGGSTGIGEACAHAFARRGARLILTARSADALDRVCRAVAPAGAKAVAADLRRPKNVDALVQRAMACYGRVDVLVNNAGVGLYVPSWQADPAQVRAMMEVNYFAPLGLIRGLVPHMLRSGGGTIVNVSSVAGKVPLPWLSLYSAGKAALNFVSDCLRMELGGTGIRVVAVCPGYVATGFPQHVLSGQIPKAVTNRAYFIITPQQCAEAIVKGVEKGKRTVLIPRTAWLFVAASRVWPGLVHAILARMREPEAGGQARAARAS